MAGKSAILRKAQIFSVFSPVSVYSTEVVVSTSSCLANYLYTDGGTLEQQCMRARGCQPTTCITLALPLRGS